MFKQENSNSGFGGGAGEVAEKRELPEEIMRLEAGLRKTADWLRQNGIPVDDECRLVIDEYDKAGFDLEEIEKDKEYVKNAEDDFAEKRMRQGGVEKSYTLGEQMERFATILMTKFFREQTDKEKRFIVVRSSRYDDIKNGIDYVVMDPKTGEIMGAIDVVVDDQNGDRLNKKSERIDEKNVGKRGGLKYGLNAKNEKIVLETRKNIPLFYLNLPKYDLENYLKKVDYFSEDLSKIENKIIGIFLKSIVEQMHSFEDMGLDQNNKKSFKKIEAIYLSRK